MFDWQISYLKNLLVELIKIHNCHCSSTFFIIEICKWLDSVVFLIHIVFIIKKKNQMTSTNKISNIKRK